MKKLNIFVDCHIFDGSLQGSSTYLNGLYSELIGEGSHHYFLASADVENLRQYFGEHPNVTYLKYASANKFARLIIDIPRMILRHKIDYAHFQYVVPPVKFCKYIVTLHDVLFLDFPEYFPKSYRAKNRFLFGMSAKMADVLLTVSEYSQQRVKHHFGRDSVVTPNAVDPVFFEDYSKDEAIRAAKQKFGVENYWIFVSRWEPRKNHFNLLRLFAERGYHKSSQLVFVGDHAIDDPRYSDYFAKLPTDVKSKVSEFNKVSRSDLLLLLRGAKLSVYPSVAEGFGIPPLEAAAAGIPSACSSTTAMSDFSFLGDVLFDPSDIDDMREKIDNALQSSSRDEVREATRQKYQWSEAAHAFLKAVSKG